MSDPWMKFYPTDWEADEALGMCSLAARGLWVAMLGVMHKAEPRGDMRVRGHAITDAVSVARAVRTGLDEVEGAFAELERWGVFSRDEDGTIYSRRMRREEVQKASARENGRKGGNPKLRDSADQDNPPDNPPPNAGVKGEVNPPNNPQNQKPEARDQKDETNVSSSRKRSPDGRGARLPDDFVPSREEAVAAGLPPDRYERTAAGFRDYWRGVAGAKGLKRDWPATWRNWCRREADRLPRLVASHGRPASPPHRPGSMAAALRRRQEALRGQRTEPAHDGPTIDMRVAQ